MKGAYRSDKSTRVALIGQKDTGRSDRMKPSCQKSARRRESVECNRAIALSGQRNAKSSDGAGWSEGRRVVGRHK